MERAAELGKRAAKAAPDAMWQFVGLALVAHCFSHLEPTMKVPYGDVAAATNRLSACRSMSGIVAWSLSTW